MAIKKLTSKGTGTRKTGTVGKRRRAESASKGQSKTGRPARPTGVKRTLKTSRKLKQWR